MTDQLTRPQLRDAGFNLRTDTGKAVRRIAEADRVDLIGERELRSARTAIECALLRGHDEVRVLLALVNAEQVRRLREEIAYLDGECRRYLNDEVQS